MNRLLLVGLLAAATLSATPTITSLTLAGGGTTVIVGQPFTVTVAATCTGTCLYRWSFARLADNGPEVPTVLSPQSATTTITGHARGYMTVFAIVQDSADDGINTITLALTALGPRLAGDALVVRVGVPVALDGTVFCDGTCTYAWEQIAGLPMEWTARTGSAPSITPLAFGEYTVRCTAIGTTTRVATLTLGAVGTQANGVVAYPADKPWLDRILGPMPRFGSSSWSELHRSNFQLLGFFDLYSRNGEWPSFASMVGSGTATVTSGSTTVTGSGTSWLTGTGKQKINAGDHISVINPANDDRRALRVASVASDTSLTLNFTAPASFTGQWVVLPDSRVIFPEGNARYGLHNIAANYYDVAAAFYRAYYSTGRTRYLTAARAFADESYDDGYFSRGVGLSNAPRNLQVVGWMLRAMDGRPAVWAGIERVADFLLAGGYTPSGSLGDTRERAYAIIDYSLIASYLMLPDGVTPNTAKRAAVLAAINSDLSVWQTFQRARDQFLLFPQPDGCGYTAPGEPGGTLPMASVTNGSPTVTIASAIPANIFAAFGGGPCGSDPQLGNKVAFQATSSRASNFDMDANDATVGYTATWTNSTTITLDRPYEGTTRSGVSWMRNSIAGTFSQPFFHGIASYAFHQAYITTGNTAWRQLAIDTGRWVRDYGYWDTAVALPNIRGMYYIRDGWPCSQPASAEGPWCGIQGDESQSDRAIARFLNGEALASLYYLEVYAPGEAATLLTAQKMTGSLFSQDFNRQVGDGYPPVTGAYTDQWGQPWSFYTYVFRGKAAGFTFGMGHALPFAALEMGGVTAADNALVSLTYNTTLSPAGRTINVQQPTGSTAAIACTGGSCSATVDIRSGQPVIM